MQYSQAGSYTVFAGVLVIILAKIGVVTDIASVTTTLGLLVTIFGCIKQFYAHKALAQAAGAIPKA